MKLVIKDAYTLSSHAIADVPEALRLEMQALYLAYYDASSAELFQADLAEKDEALLLYFGGSLVGFSMLSLYPFDWNGQRVRVLYSGDTVVAREHWGQQQLGLGWLARAGSLWREEPQTPLYWFLLVKGHRTYRYLPAFACHYFPHWQQPAPDLQALAQSLAQSRFGEHYKEEGVVAFAQSRGQLKAEIADPVGHELEKPAVRYFLERNPGYRDGHELVCLCRLEPDNLRSFGRRAFLQGMSDGMAFSGKNLTDTTTG